jgi:hypothetical protein
MMRLPRPVSSLALVLSSVLGLALADSGPAEAGHGHFSGSVRIGGGVRVRGGFSVHVGRPFAGRAFAGRPRVWVGGRWRWHSWYWPRPYYYYYYPEYVPSYYGTYYPVQPGPGEGVAAPGAVAVAPRRQPMPVLGLGVFAGGTRINGTDNATELGLLGRIRLTDGLLIEAEVAKDTLKGDVSSCSPSGFCTQIARNGERIDRRIGGSLIYELGARNSLAPYILAGGGIQQAKISGDFFGGDFTTTQDFGEIGAGLRLALSRNIHIAADIRAGRRKTIDSNQDVIPVNRSILPPTSSSPNDTEDYTRGRIAAVLNF